MERHTDRRQLLELALLAGLASPLHAAARLTDYAPATAARAVLSPARVAQLSVIAETILPETETPGAIGAGVPDFIAMMLAEWMTKPEADHFLVGHDAFERAALLQYGEAFATLDGPRRVKCFADHETAGRAALLKGAHYAPFVIWMKRLVIYGYYTSEVGASQELRYNMIPGHYVACGVHHVDEPAFSLDRYVPVFTIDSAQSVIQ